MKIYELARNVVETQDLTKTFGEDIAVQSLNMQVPRGTIFGFGGPSGCGKTTTVRLLTGFYKPTSGTLSVLGKNPADFSDADREKIGYLIQQFVLLISRPNCLGKLKFCSFFLWGRHFSAEALE